MTYATRTYRIALAALIVFTFGLGLSGTALAAGCTGAPGASAIQQYCEAVPDASGGSNHAGSKSSGSGVSSKTAATLKADGTDGAKVAALAGGTPSASTTTTGSKKKKKSAATAGPGGSSGSGSDGSGAVKDVKIDGPSDPSANPLEAASKAVASGPTIGGGVVWGLVGISALGVLGAVFARRRGSNGDPFDPPNDAS